MWLLRCDSNKIDFHSFFSWLCVYDMEKLIRRVSMFLRNNIFSSTGNEDTDTEDDYSDSTASLENENGKGKRLEFGFIHPFDCSKTCIQRDGRQRHSVPWP